MSRVCVRGCVCVSPKGMPRPGNIRKKRAPSPESDSENGDDDRDTATALERARAAQAQRARAKGLDVGTLISGKASKDDTKPAGKEAEDAPGSTKELRMLGTNSAFASAGVVLAGQEMVRDEGAGEGGAYGLRTAEEARAKAYVEEELRRRRGELVDGDGPDSLVDGSAARNAGNDNRGAESWLTAIEEVDVAPERRLQNIEETERAKRAMIEGKRIGGLGEFETLKPSHLEVKESKKKPPPSATALARAQFAVGFGSKRERQQANPDSNNQLKKKFFKKKKHKR